MGFRRKKMAFRQNLWNFVNKKRFCVITAITLNVEPCLKGKNESWAWQQRHTHTKKNEVGVAFVYFSVWGATTASGQEYLAGRALTPSYS